MPVRLCTGPAGNTHPWGCPAGNMRRRGHLTRMCALVGMSSQDVCAGGDIFREPLRQRGCLGDMCSTGGIY
jgi:hypothetical protein